MKKYFLYVILFVILFSSCEKVIDMDIQDSERRIVLNSVLSPEEVFKANITRSLFILQKESIYYLPSADVYVEDNGVFLEKLSYTENGNFSGSLKPVPGHQYNIKAHYPELDDISASASIPMLVKILKVDTSMVSIHNDMSFGSMPAMSFSVFFNDPPNEENFYLVKAINEINDTIKPFDTLYIDPSDPFINQWGSSFFTTDNIVEFTMNYNQPNSVSSGSFGGGNNRQIFGEAFCFSDQLFQGKQKAFQLFSSNTIQKGEVKFYLICLSKDYFFYLKSLANYNSTKGDPFSERVQVYNNISGGFGILGSTITDSLAISFP